MTNKKYYHSEVIEFQNEDTTIAKQLTIKKLKLLTNLFKDHDKEQRKHERRILAEIDEAKKANKEVDEQEIFDRVQEELEAEGSATYIDTLAAGCVIALNAWGVKTPGSKKVTNLDVDYVEENLDYPTMARVCEIAGSMELGSTKDDEGKDQGLMTYP